MPHAKSRKGQTHQFLLGSLGLFLLLLIGSVSLTHATDPKIYQFPAPTPVSPVNIVAAKSGFNLTELTLKWTAVTGAPSYGYYIEFSSGSNWLLANKGVATGNFAIVRTSDQFKWLNNYYRWQVWVNDAYNMTQKKSDWAYFSIGKTTAQPVTVTTTPIPVLAPVLAPAPVPSPIPILAPTLSPVGVTPLPFQVTAHGESSEIVPGVTIQQILLDSGYVKDSCTTNEKGECFFKVISDSPNGVYFVGKKDGIQYGGTINASCQKVSFVYADGKVYQYVDGMKKDAVTSYGLFTEKFISKFCPATAPTPTAPTLPSGGANDFYVIAYRASNTPEEGVTVEQTSPDGKINAKCTTDKFGQCRFSPLEATHYYVGGKNGEIYGGLANLDLGCQAVTFKYDSIKGNTYQWVDGVAKEVTQKHGIALGGSVQTSLADYECVQNKTGGYGKAKKVSSTIPLSTLAVTSTSEVKLTSSPAANSEGVLAVQVGDQIEFKSYVPFGLFKSMATYQWIFNKQILQCSEGPGTNTCKVVGAGSDGFYLIVESAEQKVFSNKILIEAKEKSKSTMPVEPSGEFDSEFVEDEDELTDDVGISGVSDIIFATWKEKKTGLKKSGIQFAVDIESNLEEKAKSSLKIRCEATPLKGEKFDLGEYVKDFRIKQSGTFNKKFLFSLDGRGVKFIKEITRTKDTFRCTFNLPNYITIKKDRVSDADSSNDEIWIEVHFKDKKLQVNASRR